MTVRPFRRRLAPSAAATRVGPVPIARPMAWVFVAGLSALLVGQARDRTAAQVPAALVFTDVTAGNQVELFTAQADGTGRRQRGNTPDVIEAGPGWAPDGRRVAFTARVAENRWALHILDLADDAVTPVTQGPLDYDPSWSPLGDRIAFAGHFEIGGQIDSSTLSVARPDGLDTRPLVLLEGRDPFIRHPTWAPDGTRLAFTLQSNLRDAELYAVNADGTGPRRLLTHPGWDDLDPAWSPDGRWIAFASGAFTMSSANTRHAIWLLDVASGVYGTVATDAARDLRRPAWSPDSGRIVFDARAGTGAASRWTLHIVPIYGGDVGPPVTTGREPDWAPPAGRPPTATPTDEGPAVTSTDVGPTPSPTPTSIGPTPTGGTTNTPPPIPTVAFPTLVPFPTFPPPEPTISGPAPTFPPPTATPTITPTPSRTPTASRTATLTDAATAPPTPTGLRVFLPVAHNSQEATPTPEVTPTVEATATTDVTPTPDATPSPGSAGILPASTVPRNPKPAIARRR